MSQDQKPTRVRMVAGSGGRTVMTVGAENGEAIAAAVPDAAPVKKGRGGLLAIALFLVGCIGGGVAVARLVP